MRIRVQLFLLSIVLLLSGCGPSTYYQYKNKKQAINTVVLMQKEQCDGFGKGRLYFYRLNGKPLLNSKYGYQVLWLTPGFNRVTVKYIAKGRAHRYIYTSYEDIVINGKAGKNYLVRFKRVKFKKVNIWLESLGQITDQKLGNKLCKQKEYKIPYDWIVY